MTVTNNVTRFLDAHKVKYEAHELPPEKLGAVEAAQHMGVPPEQVFKTIVVTREKKKPLLTVIPGPRVVDLKKLAAFLNEKKVFLPTEREKQGQFAPRMAGLYPNAFAFLLNSQLHYFISILGAHLCGEI